MTELIKMTEFNPINSVWTEKYRPRHVADIVGDFKEKILGYLEHPESLPNFLFHSTAPGTGKTTLARAIITDLGCDSLFINSSDDRQLEVVREKVKSFAMTKSIVTGKKRCVFMDEIDGMLKPSQDALRTVMETYSRNCFFILCANNINKIIEPIQSRCVIIPFAYPDRTQVVEYLNMICASEGMEGDEGGITKIMELNYPSIRNCVLSLQDTWTEKKAVTAENVHPINELFEELWNSIREKNWNHIKEVILSSTLDAREVNRHFWTHAVAEGNSRLIQLCCQNERDIAVGADPKVIVVSSLLEMAK